MNQVDEWAPVDALGEALHFLRMSGVFYSCSEFTAPWGLAMPPMADLLSFHFVTAGRFWLQVEGTEPRFLQSGDLALVPHGRGHQLLSEPGVRATSLWDMPRELMTDRYEIIRFGGGGMPTSLICGAVRFDHPAAQQLIEVLPAVIHVEATSSPHLEWVQTLLRFMAVEAKDLRAGGETVITRLADILVIQAIRAWLDQEGTAKTGWLGALQDRQIGHAIALIHRDPARDWTLASLARETAMSRSAFAARFTALVGEPAMHYVTRWRMHLAATWLREGDIGLQDLATRLGYQSEAAFSRAFKRVVGVSAGSVKRAARAESTSTPAS